MILYVLIFILLYIPVTILFPTRVVNRKVFKKVRKEGIIIAANHQSGIDIAVLGVKFWRKQHFVAKKELTNFFLLNWIIKGCGSFAIERNKPNLEFFKKATKLLANKKVITIFPEGTRKKISNEEIGQLKNGCAMLAIKSKVKIIPMYFVKKPGLFKFNKIIVGEPFDLTQFEKVSHDSLREASEIIATKFKELAEKSNKTQKKS